MELTEMTTKYYYLKRKMESAGLQYGLTDVRTVVISQELDSLIAEIMMTKYPELQKKRFKQGV